MAAAKKTAKKATAKKAAAKKTTVKTATEGEAKPVRAVKATKRPKKVPGVTVEALARAAYLNYRRRVEQGLPGDSDGDWLEAERQLSQGE